MNRITKIGRWRNEIDEKQKRLEIAEIAGDMSKSKNGEKKVTFVEAEKKGWFPYRTKTSHNVVLMEKENVAQR